MIFDLSQKKTGHRISVAGFTTRSLTSLGDHVGDISSSRQRQLMLRFRTDCAREHTGKCGCIDTNGLTAKSTSHQPPHVTDKCIVGNVTLQLRILLRLGASHGNIPEG